MKDHAEQKNIPVVKWVWAISIVFFVLQISLEFIAAFILYPNLTEFLIATIIFALAFFPVQYMQSIANKINGDERGVSNSVVSKWNNFFIMLGLALWTAAIFIVLSNP